MEVGFSSNADIIDIADFSDKPESRRFKNDKDFCGNTIH